MKDFQGLNYYEILEIPLSASPFEIRQAYKEALSIYSEDSLFTYSLFTDEERGEILRNIEEAFLTLVDKKKRADYDKKLVDSGRADPAALAKKDQKKPIPLFHGNELGSEEGIMRRVRKKVQEKDVREMSDETLSKELISGDDLKRLREARGIELQEVFELTRISVSILDWIENDELESLPPTLYLKNFLRTYAEILQVDPERVIDGYTKNVKVIKDKSA